MAIYQLGDDAPHIPESAYVANGATVIGNVTLGERASNRSWPSMPGAERRSWPNYDYQAVSAVNGIKFCRIQPPADRESRVRKPYRSARCSGTKLRSHGRCVR